MTEPKLQLEEKANDREAIEKILTATTAPVYAKQFCNTCRGRGIIHISHPQLQNEWFAFCDCAVKGVRKKIKKQSTAVMVLDTHRNMLVNEDDIGIKVTYNKDTDREAVYYPGAFGFTQ